MATTYYPSRPVLKALTLRERPAQKLAFDPTACTQMELLAALVGGQYQIEIAQSLFREIGDLVKIYNAPASKLVGIPGVGPNTATRIKAGIALGMRLVERVPGVPQGVHSPQDAYSLVQDMTALTEEHFKVILLNQRSKVIAVIPLYKGNLHSVTLRIAEIMKPAIEHSAASIVLVHNHPSGDPEASLDDVKVTKQIVEGAKLFDIEVIDHIIVGKNPAFYSMKKSIPHVLRS
jgi:DNA repair protein RadC